MMRRARKGQHLVERSLIEDEIISDELVTSVLDGSWVELEDAADATIAVEGKAVFVASGAQEPVQQNAGCRERISKSVAYEPSVDPAEPFLRDCADTADIQGPLSNVSHLGHLLIAVLFSLTMVGAGG